MSSSKFPKTKELQDAELEAFKYLLTKVEEHEKRIKHLEQKNDE